MGEQTYTRRIAIYIDSGQALAAQEQLLKRQAEVTASIKKYTDVGKEIPEKLTKQLNDVNAALDRQNKKISGELSPSLKDLTGTVAKLRRELQGMSEEDPLYALKTSHLNEAEGALTSLRAEMKKVNTNWTDMLKNAGGVALGVLFAGGVQAIAQTVMAALAGLLNFRNEFEAAVKNLSAITGATGADLAFLRNAALELASTGSRSATEYVQAMKFIASAKPELLKSKEGLMEVVKAAALLSRASGEDLPNSSKQLTDAMNQYGAPASEAAKYVDILAAAAKYGAAEIPEVTDALLQFGPVAKQMKVSFAESASAIELLAEKGIKGAEAGTKLRNILLALSTSKSLPKEALEYLKAYHVNTDILSDSTLSLEKRLTELSKISGDTNAMQAVFDKQNIAAGQTLLTNIPRYAQLTEQVKEQGVANAQAATNTGTLAGAWGKLVNAFKTLSLGVGLDWLKGIVSGVADAVTGFAKLTGIIQSNVMAVQDERQELLLAEARITSLNVGQEDRIKLVQDLQEKYPAFLGNLKAESATNEEIAAAIAKVNNMLLTKIAMAQIQERLDDAAKDRVKEEVKLADIELAMQKELTSLLNTRSSAANKYNKEQLEGMSLQQQAAQILTGNIRLQEVSSVSLVDLNNLTSKYNKQLQEKNTAVDDYNKVLIDQMQVEAALKKQLGIQDVAATPEITTTTAETGDEKAKRDKADKERIDGLKKLLAEIEKVKQESFVAGLSGNDKEVEAVRVKYERLKAEARKYGVDLAILEKLQAAEIKGINQASDLKDANTRFATRLQLTDTYYADEKRKLRQALADKKITLEQYEVEIALLDVNHKNAKADVAREMVNESADAATQFVTLNKAANDADLEYYIDTQKKKEAANATFVKNVTKAEEDIANRQVAGRKQVVDVYVQFAQQALSGLGQILNNIDTAQTEQRKVAHDKEVGSYDGMLKRKEISQKQHDRQIERLNKEFAAKEHAEKVKAFKREQAIKIVETIITTAAASIQAYNSLAGIPIVGAALGAAAAAATAAMGAVQVGIISSQQPPSYGEGTESLFGPKHNSKSKGMPVINPETGKTEALLEGEEAIISARTNKANKPIIRALMAANGRSIADKFGFGRSKLNFERVSENVQYGNGTLSFSRNPAQSRGIDNITIIENSTGNKAKPNKSIGIDNITIIELAKRQDEQLAKLTTAMMKMKVSFVKKDYDDFNDTIKTSFKKAV